VPGFRDAFLHPSILTVLNKCLLSEGGKAVLTLTMHNGAWVGLWVCMPSPLTVETFFPKSVKPWLYHWRATLKITKWGSKLCLSILGLFENPNTQISYNQNIWSRGGHPNFKVKIYCSTLVQKLLYWGIRRPRRNPSSRRASATVTKVQSADGHTWHHSDEKEGWGFICSCGIWVGEGVCHVLGRQHLESNRTMPHCEDRCY
jgi:hypothetical protein